MDYVVTGACIRCKYTDCVEVCPVQAIFPESEVPEAEREFIAFNAELARKWSAITERQDPRPDADMWGKVPDKRRYLEG